MKSAQDDKLLSANDVINLTFKMAPRLIKRVYRVLFIPCHVKLFVPGVFVFCLQLLYSQSSQSCEILHFIPSDF